MSSLEWKFALVVVYFHEFVFETLDVGNCSLVGYPQITKQDFYQLILNTLGASCIMPRQLPLQLTLSWILTMAEGVVYGPFYIVMNLFIYIQQVYHFESMILDREAMDIIIYKNIV